MQHYGWIEFGYNDWSSSLLRVLDITAYNPEMEDWGPTIFADLLEELQGR